ncbi:MAG: hypothetical protein U5K36_09785 [Roseovarius sp.]|nr:hypothetical protein [Roseovarius sp.]
MSIFAGQASPRHLWTLAIAGDAEAHDSGGQHDPVNRHGTVFVVVEVLDKVHHGLVPPKDQLFSFHSHPGSRPSVFYGPLPSWCETYMAPEFGRDLGGNGAISVHLRILSKKMSKH